MSSASIASMSTARTGGLAIRTPRSGRLAGLSGRWRTTIDDTGEMVNPEYPQSAIFAVDKLAVCQASCQWTTQ